MEANEVTHQIIGAAMKVHNELGPGLLESTYEACLEFELRKRGFQVQRQKKLPVRYDNLLIDAGYRVDLVVSDLVLVELKSVAKLDPIHEAQIITYLKLSSCQVALLINFNVRNLKDGIRRRVWRFQETNSSVQSCSELQQCDAGEG